MAYFPPRGHVLWHPRGEREPDPGLVANIDEKGFQQARAPMVWRQVAVGGEVTLDGTVLKQGEALCIVIYGSRRTKALYALQQRRRENGMLKKHEYLILPVFFFTGSEGDALLLREEEDGDPLKEPHSPGVVAHTFRMAAKCGKTFEDMLHVAPRDYEKSTVRAMLRWDELLPEVAEALDRGVVKIDDREYATFINVIGPLIDDVPRSRQVEMFHALVKDRKRTPGSARLFLRQWFEAEKSDHEAAELDDRETDTGGEQLPSRRALPPPPAPVGDAEGDPALGVPSFDEDGPFGGDDAEAERPSSDAAENEAPVRRRNTPATVGARTPVQRTSRATLKRLGDLLTDKARPSKLEKLFVLGTRCGLGRDEVAKVAGELVALKALPPEAEAVLLGVFFREGVWGPAVQRRTTAVGGGIPELVEAARGGAAGAKSDAATSGSGRRKRPGQAKT